MAIVKDIDSVKDVLSVHSDLDFNALKSFVNDVELKYILPILGKTLYTELSDNVNFTGIKKELVEQITIPVVTLAFHQAIPYLNVGVSGSGGLTVGGNEYEKAASQVRTEDLKRATLNDGHNRLDTLMQFIEDNATALEINYANLQKVTSHFLPNAKAISNYVPLEQNRFIFSKMIPVLKNLETTVLPNILGHTLYDLVVTSFEAEVGLDSQYETLAALCAPILAHLTFSESLLAIGLTVDERGITIFNSNYAETVNVRVPAGANNITALKNRHESLAEQSIQSLVTYLNANVVTFPSFTESIKYVAEEETEDNTSFNIESPDGNIVL